ncbi:MAG: LysR family substrate-binding domain-containing protein [Nocardioides sp.]
MVFRVGFVTGATPDKWARAWRDRSRVPLELVPVSPEDQQTALAELDMCLVRLPVEAADLHVIALYQETPVVVLAQDHYLTLAERVSLADLAEEQLVLGHPYTWTPQVDQLTWPQMTVKDAIEVVASGQGIVLLPKSIGRLHHRKDVVSREVDDLAPTTVALAWRQDRDDDLTQAFVAVVRGRSANSSRR